MRGYTTEVSLFTPGKTAGLTWSGKSQGKLDSIQSQGFIKTFNTVITATAKTIEYAIYTMANFTRNCQNIPMYCHVHRTYLLLGTQMECLFLRHQTFHFGLCT